MPEIILEGIEGLKDTIAEYPALAGKAAERAMMEALVYLHGELPKYPDSAPIIPPDGVSFLRTEKQKAWFFASARKGQLKGWTWIDGHPEKESSTRTATQGRRFTENFGYSVSGEKQEVIGELGTNLGYAPWVVGPDFPGGVINGRQMYQARVHVDRWWQFDDVIAEAIEEAWKVFDEEFQIAFKKEVDDALGGTNGI